MSLKNFKTFQLASQVYRECEKLQMPRHLKDQLSRASSSVALNVAEGSGRVTPADRRRFFTIAYASCKEVMAILSLTGNCNPELLDLVDHTAACLYKLKTPF